MEKGRTEIQVKGGSLLLLGGWEGEIRRDRYYVDVGQSVKIEAGPAFFL